MTDGPDSLQLSARVGNQLRMLRQQRQTTLDTVSERSDISLSHLSEIEKGTSACSLPVLLRICRALDTSIAEVLPSLRSDLVRVDQIGPSAADGRVLSHEELSLEVREFVLAESDICHVSLDRADTTIFVVSGLLAIEGHQEPISLGRGDSVRLQSVVEISILTRSTGPAVALALISRN